MIWPTNGYPIRGTTRELRGQLGQYAVGPAEFRGTRPPRSNLPVDLSRSAFGHTSVRLASITDGTSNTVFTAETLQGRTNDVRGAIWTLAGRRS